MADLVLAPDGITHVMSPQGDGTFTYCGREVGCTTQSGFGTLEEFTGVNVDEGSSSNCKHCHDEITAIRKSLKRLRWRSTMVDPDRTQDVEINTAEPK